MQITLFGHLENRCVNLGSRNRRAGSRRIRVASLAILFLLLIASAMPLVLAESETYVVVNQWGGLGENSSEFNGPHGVAVDSSGNVYVVDSYNNRIQKFDGSGVFLTKWGAFGSGNGNFTNPYGIAVDGSGYVYVADAGNRRIQKFDSNGVYITSWGGPGERGFGSAQGVAVDGSGKVYVADNGNHRICKFDSNGVYITEWGGYGSEDGKFNWPYGVGVDSSGNVYVVDTYNNRIQKFDSNGVFISKWGSFGSNNSEFYNPAAIAFDSSGNVYVADSTNCRIQKFSSNGVFKTVFYTAENRYCYGVAVDSLGNVYASNGGGDRPIWKFALSSPATTPTPSTVVTSTPTPTPTPTPASPPKGPCIIATATYGGPLASEVVFMRSVRDDLIGASPTGSVLVNAWNSFYYSWSPPVASAIADSGGLKTLSSALLAPLLGSMYVVAGVYDGIAWLSPDLAAVVSFMIAAALSISIYILLPAIAIRYGVKLARNSWKRRSNRFKPA
jgi:sugar lactone lactonase YvrE